MLRRRRSAEAMDLSQQLADREPEIPESWILLARASQQAGDLDAMADYAERAMKLAPDRLDVCLIWAESLSYLGRIAEALAELGEIEARAGADGPAWDRLTMLYTQLGRHEAAYRCADRLTALSPNSLGPAFHKASAGIATGRLDEAEALLERIIAAKPDEADAHYNLATLRRQTEDRNHVSRLQSQLAATTKGGAGEAPLYYALAKELEDLGRYDEAFEHLARGAAARRSRVRYDIAADVTSMDHIIGAFDSEWWGRAEPGPEVSGPIFVLGLPRSGTTLVDRILSSLDDVTSLGEVNDLAYAVMRAGGPVSGKTELIENVAKSDLGALAETYWQALRGYGENAACLIDKTPANFLYLGLIMKALPGAKIVHIRRHPMASGYAVFKTLFRMGYPFSYDLEEIATYMLGYRRLMAHWHALAPGRILDVDYEALVDEQETESRRIVAHCGLAWSEAVLAFHKSETATATASAAQVRQPLYRHARDIWRNYEGQLAPLADALKAGGAL